MFWSCDDIEGYISGEILSNMDFPLVIWEYIQVVFSESNGRVDNPNLVSLRIPNAIKNKIPIKSNMLVKMQNIFKMLLGIRVFLYKNFEIGVSHTVIKMLSINGNA